MRLTLLLVGMRWLAFGQEPAKVVPPVPADRRADTYAVYSAVLAHPSLSHPDDNKKYVIEELSGAMSGARETDPGSCVVVPEDYRAAFTEVLADRSEHHEELFRLERAFTIPKPYDLITEAQARQFVASRNGRVRIGDEVELFPGAVDLITLGNVYFDRKRTVASVYTSAYCGSLCGLWTWRVFVKNAKGGWDEPHWSACMTIAASRSTTVRPPPVWLDRGQARTPTLR